MTTNERPEPFALGDIVSDDYANPAVIVKIEQIAPGRVHYSIMQVAGSDRGRIASPPLRNGQPVRVEALDPEAVRQIVRDEARRQGWKWNAKGITR